mmetsp:Transcript_48034/g.86657  ORF Transcript_48034/g.86657 Transcript_48034/m.86657 type:complete len:205 (-) Transcript_48034:656-1270(-)
MHGSCRNLLHVLGPVLVLWTIGWCNANLLVLYVKDDFLVYHPCGTQDSVGTWSIIFEAVAPVVIRALPEHVSLCDPLRFYASKDNLNDWKLFWSCSRQFPAVAMFGATAAISCAVIFDCAFQPSIVGAPHVGVRSPTVNHRTTPGSRDRLPVNLHCRKLHRVEARRIQSNLLHRPSMVRLVIATHIESATPLRKANGKDLVADV